VDLERVDRITAGAVGEPGERTFFLQAREGDRSITILVEKEQVELLGTSILEILATVGRETGEGPPSDELGLEPPLEPLWRAGRLSIGYAEERDLMLLEIEELVEQEDEPDEEEDETDDRPSAGRARRRGPEPGRVRLWATREQMLALARHGAAVAERGRPKCRYCGNPIDPQGHMCPGDERAPRERGPVTSGEPERQPSERRTDGTDAEWTPRRRRGARAPGTGHARGPRPAPPRLELHLPRPGSRRSGPDARRLQAAVGRGAALGLRGRDAGRPGGRRVRGR
jgi:uncharacterized repeat protein (TIGR03847 family)